MDITASTEDQDLVGQRESTWLRDIRDRAGKGRAEGRSIVELTNGDLLKLIDILDRHKANLLAATDRVVELESAMQSACDLIFDTVYFRTASEIAVSHTRAIETVLARISEDREHISSLINQLADCEAKRDADLELRQQREAEQERREADVGALLSVVAEALDEIDPRYSLGTVLEGKLTKAMAKVNEWLPKE